MPLQKSFSDQNHSAKNGRPRWTRNNSYQGQSRREPEPRRETPAIVVSAATRSKLDVFQFGASGKEGGPLSAMAKPAQNSEDKENDGARPMQRTKLGTPREALKPSSQQYERQTKMPPTTPAAKLEYADLIGMVDAQIALEQEVSPDERIMWNNDSGSMDSSLSPFPLQRPNKRARSSSPSSSPAHASSNRPDRDIFEMKRLSQSLKTPQGEPGSELWDRYAVSTRTSGNRPQNPALAHIMNTSSPQSSRDGSGDSGGNRLKRSTSCGSQWPKRRRVADPREDGLSKLSRVNALLERVQENNPSKSKSSALAHPSSSSPAPLRSDTLEYSGSPISRRPILHTRNSGHTQNINSNNEAFSAHNSEVDEAEADPASSDYGDFDDDDFEGGALEALIVSEETVQPIMVDHQIAKNALRNIQFEDAPGIELVGELSASTIIVDDDEFGELDDEDLEDIVAKIDGQVPSEVPVPMLNINQTEVESPTTLADEGGSDDEFGDGLDDADFEIAEAATQSLQQPNDSQSSFRKPRAIQRYLIMKIFDSTFENIRGRTQAEKVLLVEIEQTNEVRTIHLRDDWIETSVTVKAYVHVIGEFERSRIVIDNANNMLILHPDHLLSSTVVADSFSCTRRAVLQDRVKATSQSSPPLVYGTILHEIFQAAIKANRWDTPWLTDTITDIATRHLEDLYTIQVQMAQAVEYLRSKMGELQAWAELFVSAQPKAGAVVQAQNGASATMCVSKLLDVEEHVWSPMYGLKGNIDATVEVVMQDGLLDEDKRTLTVPFEVKTGKTVNASHRAQTALYNLLLSDRYDVEIAYGILYYMETSETIRIPVIRNELRHMVMQRNELACFVRERHAQLPPMLKKESLCNRCYAKVPCFIYHKLADDGDGATSGMHAKFDEVVRHLTSKHKEFFIKWDDLLTKEEKESMKFRRELWTMLSTEREKLGRCFSNVIIEPGSAFEEQNNPKINRYRYTLIKEKDSAGFSFLESQIGIGEPIVISDEKGHFALANGYVTHVRKHRITVAVDRRLHNARIRQPGFDAANNQVFASIMEVDGEGVMPTDPLRKSLELPVKYRLDKDEFSNGMATVRNNLIQVMAEGPLGSREARSLVVDLVAPKFKHCSTAYVLKDNDTINVDQRRAIEKVMSAQDYALVLGMPGTGKTTTIAHIIRALVSQGKSVLLTSYTHTAVDNILLKLKDDQIPVLRLGSVAKVHPDVQEFAHLAATPMASFEEIRSVWHDSPVVATTCLGINHPIFAERRFDYCIVDEASQITLPVCLGPIRMSRTFILVGDHNQLPPLVQNEQARVGGLDISLFKLLSDTHPSSVVYLEHQYRMCEEVMALSNHLIYSGRLQCGTPEVASRSINIPAMGNLRNIHFAPSTLSRTKCVGSDRGRCWIQDILDPSVKARFINTDSLLPFSREEAKGNRIVNPTEARIVTQIVESLLSVGVPASTIGVITHYRSQLGLLKYNLRAHADVEKDTADRFQGRDKEVIILSLVRSNEGKHIGELLKDWRRINVALTRAKTKLLVVGSRETLKGNDSENGGGKEEMVAKFVGLMEERSWVYDLPKDALECHHFEDGATQATASTAGRPSNTQWKAIDTIDQGAACTGQKNLDRARRGLETQNKEVTVRAQKPNRPGKENQALIPQPRKEPKRVGPGKRVVRSALKDMPVVMDVIYDLMGEDFEGEVPDL